MKKKELGARRKKLLKEYIDNKKIEREETPLVVEENESFFDKTIREETKERLGVELTKEELSELASFEKCKWTLDTLWSNQGVISLKRDAQSIEKLALIFPVIFFALSILVTSSTMHRMVEEERNSLGILKYLGYNTKQILLKYLIYIIIAILIGGTIGCIIGNILIPDVVWKAYKLMYNIDRNIIYEVNAKHIISGFLLMIISSCFATVYTVKKYMKVPTAELLRNKKEKLGKKSKIETTKLWKKIKFKNQVRIKNIIRYKKRLIITTIGVAGSITLVLAGFGIYDAISQIIEYQTRKTWKYDIEINLNNRLTGYYLQEETNLIEQNSNVESCIQVCMRAGTISNKGIEEDVQIVIPKYNEELNDYINLETIKNEKYTLDDTSIAVTQKVAEMLKIKVGDNITVTSLDGKTAKLKVGAVVKNYISHYIYISKRLYIENLGGYTLNTVFAKRKPNLTQEEKDDLNKKILQSENVKYLVDTDTLITLIDDQVSSLNYAVAVLIISSRTTKFCSTV